MKKPVTARIAVLAPAAFAKDLSFADLQSLESIDGYSLYGTPAEDADQAYIFIDGGAREGKSRPFMWSAYSGGAGGICRGSGKTLAEYLRNGDVPPSSIPCNAPTKNLREANCKPIPKARPCHLTAYAACPKWRLAWCAIWKQAQAASQRRNCAIKPVRLIL